MLKIIASAIWYKNQPTAAYRPSNVEKGVVLCGFNHAQIIQQHVSIAGKSAYMMGENEQGFLTNDNRFVDRKEARVIAEAAGQLKEDFKRTDLYSEFTNYDY